MLQGDLVGVVPSETARGRTARARQPNVALPGIDRDDQGKPRLPLDPATLYAFGHLIRGTEQLLLELFTKGLLSGSLMGEVGGWSRFLVVFDLIFLAASWLVFEYVIEG